MRQLNGLIILSAHVSSKVSYIKIFLVKGIALALNGRIPLRKYPIGIPIGTHAPSYGNSYMNIFSYRNPCRNFVFL